MRNAELVIIIISKDCEWNNCFIKNHQEMWLDLADFVLQERPEGDLMADMSWACYNG